jgi:hypothetical protein
MIRLQRSIISPLVDTSPTVASVCTTLQQAVELEHATIPLYLYGLYSLDASKNQAIVDILQSVVVEEMLHMTLSANVLSALGGSPQINKPQFIPTYPGPLPGGVDSDLTVHLAPFSMTQLEAYLSIEQPEDPIVMKSATPAVDDSITIGEFYQAIIDALDALVAQHGESIFDASGSDQGGPALMNESVVVTDLNTAKQALETIIEQGEGTATSPEEVVGDQYAHYYRFMQIKKGAYLVKNPADNSYSYSGAAITLDPTGVYALPTDPKADDYAVGSVARVACDTFNYTYTNLLLTLHDLFNGRNTQQQLNVSIGVMMSLKGQAKAMMAGIPDDQVFTGPSFQYLNVNPRATPE